MKKSLIPFFVSFLIFFSANFAIAQKVKTWSLTGKASYYSKKFEGRKTCSGEIFCHDSLTGATTRMKMGQFVKVTNLINGNSIVVKVNDRTAKKSPYLIDLTRAAASKLGFLKAGVAKVKITRATPESYYSQF